MSAAEKTMLEQSLALLFYDKKQPWIATGPKWDRTSVGASCIALQFRDTTVAGDSGQGGATQGKIFWRQRPGDQSITVEVIPVSDYEQQDNLRGRRKDCAQIVDETGEPTPEVLLLMAGLSGEARDRFTALSTFVKHRKEMAEQLLGTVVTIPPESSLGPVDHHPILSLTAEPGLFMQLVAEWMFMMMRDEHRFELLQTWQTAAHRAIKARKGLSSAEGTTDRARVLAAIKEAAKPCAGVPHQKLIREILASDGNPPIGKDTVRSIMKTLGFSWIPGEPVWIKDWKPRLERMGWA